MTVDELVNLLCQFPGETPVVVVPHYEAGGRKMWRTQNLVQVNDGDRQPVFLGLTTDCAAPRTGREIEAA